MTRAYFHLPIIGLLLASCPSIAAAQVSKSAAVAKELVGDGIEEALIRSPRRAQRAKGHYVAAL